MSTTMSQNSSAPHLYSLPNEVFVQILTLFSTRALLSLTTVSHRFHALVLRILYYRLLINASVHEYKLILECFHPMSKFIEPHIFCQYIGTERFSEQYEGVDPLYGDVDPAQRSGQLSTLYSRFRPERAINDKMGRMGVVVSDPVAQKQLDQTTITRPVDLEAFEEFSQLCVVVNVVKVMPGTQLLLSANTLEDEVVRLFRQWLKEQERINSFITEFGEDTSDDELDARDQYRSQSQSSILWVDQNKNVGLKVRVRQKCQQDDDFPVVIHQDEVLTSYEIDIEELYVRTTRLLLTMEQSSEEQQNYNKVVILTRGM